MLLMASIVLNSCSTCRINRLKNKSYKEWKAFQWTETKKSSDQKAADWTIYSRKVEGTTLMEYKIEGEIGSSPETCMAAFRQGIHHQAENPGKKYPAYEIVHESQDSLLTYVIHNEPFPFKDTEMRVQYLFINNEDCSMGVSWNEAWDRGSTPPSKKLKRIETFRGSWQFSTVSEKQSNAVNMVQFDPQGMPKWLVQPMVTKFLRDGLENIRAAASK